MLALTLPAPARVHEPHRFVNITLFDELLDMRQAFGHEHRHDLASATRDRVYAGPRQEKVDILAREIDKAQANLLLA